MNRCLYCIQIWYGCSLGIDSGSGGHYFLILMDRAYGWGVLPSIDGYFFIYCLGLAHLEFFILPPSYINLTFFSIWSCISLPNPTTKCVYLFFLKANICYLLLCSFFKISSQQFRAAEFVCAHGEFWTTGSIDGALWGLCRGGVVPFMGRVGMGFCWIVSKVFTTHTGHRPNVEVMICWCFRRWTNINSIVGRCHVASTVLARVPHSAGNAGMPTGWILCRPACNRSHPAVIQLAD